MLRRILVTGMLLAVPFAMSDPNRAADTLASMNTPVPSVERDTTALPQLSGAQQISPAESAQPPTDTPSPTASSGSTEITVMVRSKLR